jgi:hypothetical protein
LQGLLSASADSVVSVALLGSYVLDGAFMDEMSHLSTVIAGGFGTTLKTFGNIHLGRLLTLNILLWLFVIEGTYTTQKVGDTEPSTPPDSGVAAGMIHQCTTSYTSYLPCTDDVHSLV